MGKDYYDDMQERPSWRAGRDGSDNTRPSKGLIWTIALGIAICVVVIVIWYQFFPAQSKGSQGQAAVIEEVLPEVKEIADAPQIQPTEPAEGSTSPSGADAPVVDNESARAIDSQGPVRRTPTTSSASIQYAEHLVKDGEDLASIAALYNLKPQTLISVNQIRNIQAVKEGVTLIIPDRDGQLYTVREGDMLSTIARKYSPTLGWKTLQELNNLKNEKIFVGQKLFIPDTSSSSLAQLTDVSPIQFQKPSVGTISKLFGQSYKNPTTGADEVLAGILIEGDWGEAVVASAKGEVVDAGYEKKGRGRFVVLSHEGGYRSSYYHLENIDPEVKIGMSLEKGQTIGSIGTSGTDYGRPTLFFSIEQSGIALDPMQFF
ncbi:MAG: lipoprotein NlpD [Sphaerochaeta sp.]|jgi:murein DD-endopeptidase MepM/ murein hydrolase activator NlpD|uniref:LysM peptidoglycan-binding domain-containing protein n=1 Tax=Sphaerochaeta halotolerans TaxID=2293840 RepID=A0A372MEX1_9SPIR|nr:M23 family metallopeptidase [Sphaerochaeta halotolerans]MBG0766839.1 LysM peptidoglycan-binding domain-containing protein [Spirochaetaceae bacterium]MDK2858992.1 lipoprotein NlpD [Sphaerochaeta sp.]MDN5333188.1 lipoprotein NlpD [Sphaerochaeta sp.]RFU93846.1 LysM peptidoglycan-binding domain-containing protein [Sphaerochaeta halotolerans]